MFRGIELFRNLNPWISWFLPLLDSFPHPGSAWYEDFVKRIGRFHLLNSKICYQITEWRALDLAINWIISSVTSSLIMYFPPNISIFNRRLIEFWIISQFFVSSQLGFLPNFCSLISPLILIQIERFLTMWSRLGVLFIKLLKSIIFALQFIVWFDRIWRNTLKIR